MILCIETATNICSVALCSAERIISSRESNEDKSHASQLTVLIEDMLKKTSIEASKLDAVAVSKGPGSYTGLRIGVSVAKGLCYGSGIPLIAVNSLKSMYHGIMGLYNLSDNKEVNTLYCPMIDARRMDVYYSLFDREGKMVIGTVAETIEENSFKNQLEENRILFFGNGAEKCRDIIKSNNAVFIDGFDLSASYLREPAFESFRTGAFEDVAYFEPYYLKDFIATIPRKNLLRF